MNPEVKAKWVAALRSGEYKQGRGALRNAADEFCCLGVLCDLSPFPWLGPPERKMRPSYDIEERPHFLTSGYLSEPVAEWAGLVDTNPVVDGNTLSHLNDTGCPFDQIADLIEAEL